MTPEEIKAQAEREVAEEDRRILVDLEKVRIRYVKAYAKRYLFPWRFRLERKPECQPAAPEALKAILKTYGWRLRFQLIKGGLTGAYYVEKDT